MVKATTRLPAAPATATPGSANSSPGAPLARSAARPTTPACTRRKFAEPIDGDATRLVRPYIVEHEQSERRRVPALALDGIYVGPYWIHGVEVAR